MKLIRKLFDFLYDEWILKEDTENHLKLKILGILDKWS